LLGGVWVPVRDALTTGLVIDMGDATGADPATGQLTAPPATPDLLGTIKEPIADAKGYVRTTQLDGTSQWVPPALTPQEIAGNAPKDLGSVYVPARNKTSQGLNLDTSDGALYAPPATHEHLGTIVEPPEEGKQYARFRDPTTHNNEWQEIAGTFIAGNAPADVGVIYVPARNKHNQGLDLNPDGGLYAPPATHEHLGTIVEPLNDSKTYARTTVNGNSSWVETKSAEIAGFTPDDIGVIWVVPASGIGLRPDGGINLAPTTPDQIGGIVDAPYGTGAATDPTYARQNATWVEIKGAEIAGNVPLDVGVVYVPARNKTSQGLDLNADGGLYAPPATHEHLGSILEPPPDDKQYARQQTALGTFIAAAARHVATHVPDPHARELPGVGHFAPLLAPERIAAELISFFANVQQKPDRKSA